MRDREARLYELTEIKKLLHSEPNLERACELIADRIAELKLSEVKVSEVVGTMGKIDRITMSNGAVHSFTPSHVIDSEACCGSWSLTLRLHTYDAWGCPQAWDSTIDGLDADDLCHVVD